MSETATMQAATEIQEDPLAEARRIAAAVDDDDVALRLLGGVAIHLHSDDVPVGLQRAFADLDYVVPDKAGGAASAALTTLGYEPNERFNMLNGRRRLVFYDPLYHRHVDVFVGEFRMCHQIELGDRMLLDSPTIPLADLLLTKLQIVAVNRKDLQDLTLLLASHGLADHDDDAINVAHVSSVLAADWGLWRTATGTLATLLERLDDFVLDRDVRSAVVDRAEGLRAAIDAAPKSMRWRSRARIGERRRWYEEPEEIGHSEH